MFVLGKKNVLMQAYGQSDKRPVVSQQHVA